jgi:hypothetical protein
MSDHRRGEILSVYLSTTMSSYDVPCILAGPTRLTDLSHNGYTSGEAGIIADLALHKFSTKTRPCSNVTLHHFHAPSYKQHATIQPVLYALPLKMDENGIRPRSLASRLPADGLSAPSLVLQPREALSRSAEPPDQAIKPKRAQIGAACIVCQRAKTKVSRNHLQAHEKKNITFSYRPSDILKCDGVRPSCKRCTKRKIACTYDVEPGTSRLLSLRRKNEALQNEIDRLHEVVNHIYQDPEARALGTHQQPRKAVSPMEMIPHKDNDSLIHPNASSSSDHTLAPVSEDLESIAITDSTLKVQAQRWTSVAGNALVSELLSSFFVYDNCFYLSFIDQESFLHDLQTGDTERGDFCSPLLVNAICALRCVSIIRYSWDIAKSTSSLPPVVPKHLARCKALMLVNAFSQKPGVI